MPQRQLEAPAAALDWFAGQAGQGLLAAEAAAVERVLQRCPALPWAWFGVAGAKPPSPTARGIVLRRRHRDWSGAIRCRLPLPMPSESFGAVLLQHVLDDAIEPGPLLEECARVLAPGGTLWIAALNPWTPYRARWTGTGLHAADPGRWQSVLRRAGFSGSSIAVQWLGPHWRVGPGTAGIGLADHFRAGIALTVGKRVRAVIPPARLHLRSAIMGG